MNTRIAHRFNTGNRACKFAFQTAAIACVFNKLTGTERAVLLKYLQPDGFIIDQAGRSEFHSCLMHIACFDHQNLGRRINLKRNSFTIQDFDNVLCIVILHTMNQRLVGRFSRPDHDRDANGDDQCDTTDRHHLTRHWQAAESSEQRMSRCRSTILA